MVREEEIAELLSELSAVQSELLAFLTEKQKLLLDKDLEGLAACEPREQELVARLRWCHNQRAELLQKAASADLPSDNIRALVGELESDVRDHLNQQVHEAAGRARLLAHGSLTNWVFVQRSLLHLSQLLEIIATGGRLQPTYGKDDSASAGGSIVDQAA